MKAKLIKTANGYGLESELGPAFVLSTRPQHNWLKLSLKNCEAIANGYDLDELEELAWKEFPYNEWEYSNGSFGDINEESRESFIIGFKKAFEILGNKTFSKYESYKIWKAGQEYWKTSGESITFEELIERKGELLQQSEWNVEIEMEEVIIGQCDCECHSNTGIMVMHFMPCCNPKVVSNPKLDSNGCLILKKI